jgi:hypothetical protein
VTRYDELWQRQTDVEQARTELADYLYALLGEFLDEAGVPESRRAYRVCRRYGTIHEQVDPWPHDVMRPGTDDRYPGFWQVKLVISIGPAEGECQTEVGVRLAWGKVAGGHKIVTDDRREFIIVDGGAAGEVMRREFYSHLWNLIECRFTPDARRGQVMDEKAEAASSFDSTRFAQEFNFDDATGSAEYESL